MRQVLEFHLHGQAEFWYLVAAWLVVVAVGLWSLAGRRK